MTYRMNYPATVAEILDDTMTFHPDALRALKRFRRSKPWRGTFAQRWAKFMQLRNDLAAVYGVKPDLNFDGPEGGAGNGHYQPATTKIVLIGRLSVVTFLHEYAHARGMDERQAVRWSVNLFKRIFPRSYARCRHVGHTLRRI